MCRSSRRGPATKPASRLACTTRPAGPPGVRCVYSDINFILLGELVHRLSGQTLAEYARRNIFQPLGMKETTFLPPASLDSAHRAHRAPGARTAPPLRGVVHDPTARNMGGVAGHAGVFSTADDLARFAQMMLNGGELDGVRLFSPLTVGQVHRAADAARTSPSCAAWAGISIRPTPATAASCFPSARTATPGSPGRRSGSTLPPAPT